MFIEFISLFLFTYYSKALLHHHHHLPHPLHHPHPPLHPHPPHPTLVPASLLTVITPLHQPCVIVHIIMLIILLFHLIIHVLSHFYAHENSFEYSWTHSHPTHMIPSHMALLFVVCGVTADRYIRSQSHIYNSLDAWKCMHLVKTLTYT